MRMVVDTSVLVAIIQEEPGADALQRLLSDSDLCLLSAVSLFEAGMVLYARFKDEGLAALDLVLSGSMIEEVPFDAEQARIAREAFRRFGKGQGHPAQLNMGDCCAYALAKARGLPLLFKGGDFARTDIAPAVPA